MENKDIARIFEEIADILEFHDENPFRIRSYRRAAQIVENLGFNAARSVADEPGRLKGVSGIGEGIVGKIAEIAETGRCREHERLKEKIPESLLTLLEIPNVGSKKIRLFWEQLEISTVEELEEAARAGKLRDLPGMGEKSEAKILQSLEDHRRRQGRFRLDHGIELSEALMQYLRDKTPVLRIDAAGSVRRRRETIGDLDILVSCESPVEAIRVFVGHPDVEQVLAEGDTKASVILRRGLQADLRVVEDASFGAALQYFTGSKDHNVVLRDRAKRLGLKINEYGIFRMEGKGHEEGKHLGGREEKEVYEALGLDWIPPEIRENRGEIEAAEKGELPRLIKREDLRGDLHMHTRASDGRNSIEEMAQAARDLGYRYIAITDHSKALAMTRGLDERRLEQQIQDIHRIRDSRPGIEILCGIEVDILGDGTLDLSDTVLSQLDVVIASVHSRFSLTEKEMTLRICRALENPHVNVLAHPTGRLLTRRDPYAVDLEQVIRTASGNRVCLEINSYPARLDLNDVHARMAQDLGALLVINSDSHNTQMLRYLRYGVVTARRGWIQPPHVLNTRSLSDLRKVLSKEAYRE